MSVPQLLHHSCQVLSVLAGLHRSGLVALDLKPSNLLLLDINEQQQGPSAASTARSTSCSCQSAGGSTLLLADAQLHLIMAGALKDVWPSEAALADPYYK